MVWGSDRDAHALSRVWPRIRLFLGNVEYLDAYAMDDDTIRRFHDRIVARRIRVIIGYAESLDLLARVNLASGLEAPPDLETVISSAGVLSIEARARISKAMGTPVFDRYGAREGGLIAYECQAHEGLHLNCYSQVVELLPIPGEPDLHEILITNLDNYAMPLIRYRIGDLATRKPTACDCGRSWPRIAAVAGRTTDILTARDGRLVHGAAIRHALFGIEAVESYRFVQETIQSSSVFVVGRNATDGVADLIAERVKEVLGEVQVIVQVVDKLPLPPSGKHLFVMSRVPVDVSSGLGVKQ